MASPIRAAIRTSRNIDEKSSSQWLYAGRLQTAPVPWAIIAFVRWECVKAVSPNLSCKEALLLLPVTHGYRAGRVERADSRASKNTSMEPWSYLCERNFKKKIFGLFLKIL